jgi:hypothetical protein
MRGGGGKEGIGGEKKRVVDVVSFSSRVLIQGVLGKRNVVVERNIGLRCEWISGTSKRN